jgi:hypothetical protein
MRPETGPVYGDPTMLRNTDPGPGDLFNADKIGIHEATEDRCWDTIRHRHTSTTPSSTTDNPLRDNPTGRADSGRQLRL